MSILTQSFTGNFITHLRNIYMGKNIKSIEQKKKKKVFSPALITVTVQVCHQY